MEQVKESEEEDSDNDNDDEFFINCLDDGGEDDARLMEKGVNMHCWRFENSSCETILL